ncbi:hypothetical protein ACOME3_004288 [Neoechinorhynchus agilis]
MDQMQRDLISHANNTLTTTTKTCIYIQSLMDPRQIDNILCSVARRILSTPQSIIARLSLNKKERKTLMRIMVNDIADNTLSRLTEQLQLKCRSDVQDLRVTVTLIDNESNRTYTSGSMIVEKNVYGFWVHESKFQNEFFQCLCAIQGKVKTVVEIREKNEGKKKSLRECSSTPL